MDKAEIVTKEPLREMTAIVTDASHEDIEGVQCQVLENLIPKSDAVHLVLKPTNQEWQNQYELFSLRSTSGTTGEKKDICSDDSAIVALLNRLNEMGLLSGKLDGANDFRDAVLKAMVGNEFSMKEEMVGRKLTPSWMPVELLKKAETVEG